MVTNLKQINLLMKVKRKKMIMIMIMMIQLI
ncbi:unnamed protein product [Schistosoma mattheei]|uniref:Uncharacterized protein n=1 Tax=Schistosoma mattheei TaxID=31246 RepID=A0A3P8HHP4_9TREM|nr:unnamed protein product [Schistosoma mattheei]